MINKVFYSIFQQGSKTMFYSSIFLPKKIRYDVFILYGFVRKADNLVDTMPQDKEGFYKFRQNYEQAKNGIKTGDIVIDSFVELAKRKNFDPKWTEAFLDSMEMDLTKKTYYTLDETLEYVYGAAEVIGLYMVNILNLDKKLYIYARYLGRALQFINTIRDIAEDLEFGRSYIPLSDLDHYKLESLDYEYTKQHPERFSSFIKGQIARYSHWQEMAEKGYKYIPKRYLISVKTASDMYNWTAEQILKKPFIVYEWKVKPRIIKILTNIVKNLIDPTIQKTKLFSNNVLVQLQQHIIEQIEQ
ncbi:MAG: phytoene/squalene synthase family protein [Candidatus Thermoplasmatota archaeon]|nr:phytoene/squalene synthase family protein [Candidatus Thermoplasmatota archaeon]